MVIVNTASLAGLVPSPMLAPYAMTKHAVVGLSVSLRPEAAMHGIRVSALCPGPTETPILDSRGPDDLAPRRRFRAGPADQAAGEIYPVEDLSRTFCAASAKNQA